MFIRGHHLLCLQGFRGLGYSDEFVSRMKMVTGALAGNHDQIIQVGAEPDIICQACPHNKEGCQKNCSQDEINISLRDKKILARLDLAEYDRRTYGEILDLIKKRIPAQDLATFCHSCPWLSLGYCNQGIALL